MHVTRRLRSGSLAEWTSDPFRAGALVLSVDGSEQSHVDLADPNDLALEYVRRIGWAVDAAAAPGAPLRVLHLGGGGLTLARYVAVTRPGSVQYVVEAEIGLLDFVLAHAPLPAGADVDVVIGDAGTALPLAGVARAFDLVIVDVYVGTEVPRSLLDTAFVDRLGEQVGADGVVAVNVADEAGLPLARRWRRRFAARFAHTALIAAADVIAGRGAGNAVLLASGGDGLHEVVDALLRNGPHPAAADA